MRRGRGKARPNQCQGGRANEAKGPASGKGRGVGGTVARRRRRCDDGAARKARARASDTRPDGSSTGGGCTAPTHDGPPHAGAERHLGRLKMGPQQGGGGTRRRPPLRAFVPKDTNKHTPWRSPARPLAQGHAPELGWRPNHHFCGVDSRLVHRGGLTPPEQRGGTTHQPHGGGVHRRGSRRPLRGARAGASRAVRVAPKERACPPATASSV